MIEKHGVCAGEGEAPKPETTQAPVKAAESGCCGGACGTDPMSKMAEKVADTIKDK